MKPVSRQEYSIKEIKKLCKKTGHKMFEKLWRWKKHCSRLHRRTLKKLTRKEVEYEVEE